MQILVGEWSLVFGLDWLMPSNKKEARAEKRRHRAEDCVAATSSSGRHLGFHAKVTGTAYAAALIVGIAKRNAVICQNLDEITSWVCFLDDGVPVSGSDRILPTYEAQELARGWRNDDPAVDLIGDIDGASVSVKQVLDDLQAGLRNGTVARKDIERAVVGPTGWTLRRIFLIGAVAGTVVASYFVYDNVNAMMEARATSQLSLEQQLRAAIESEQERARVAARQKELRAAFDSQLVAARERMRERVDPASLWGNVSRLRATLPISLHGYRPQELNCTAASCTVSWLGQGRSTRAVDKLALPNVQRTLSADLTAVSTFDLAPEGSILPDTAARSPDELALLVNSNFARYGSFTLSLMAPVVITPPAELKVTPVHIGAVAKWTAQFSGPTALVEASEIIGRLSRWPARLTGMKYQRNGGAVSLEGEVVHVTRESEDAN